MWTALKKLNRVKNALKHNDIDPDCINLDKLVDLLVKKGMVDRILNIGFKGLLVLLEPKPCTMSHCKNYGGDQYFCRCKKGGNPKRCKTYFEYRTRIKLRDSKWEL